MVDKRKSFNFKEVPMRKSLAVLFLVAMFAACGGTTTVDAPMPVTIDGPVVVQDCAGLDQCVETKDCPDVNRFCVMFPGVSETCGFAVSKCVLGCDARLKDNADGTVSKVDGTDTCQRDGDMKVYCEMGKHECATYPQPTPDDGGTPTPDDGTPTPNPTDADKFYQLTCCFKANALKSGMYMQASASTSTAANPESSMQDTDLSLNGNCASSTKKFARGSVFLGYWVELTQGKAEDWVDANGNGKIDQGEIVKGQWLGALSNGAFLPTSCTLDGVAVPVGPQMPTCGAGIADAVGKSCRN